MAQIAGTESRPDLDPKWVCEVSGCHRPRQAGDLFRNPFLYRHLAGWSLFQKPFESSARICLIRNDPIEPYRAFANYVIIERKPVARHHAVSFESQDSMCQIICNNRRPQGLFYVGVTRAKRLVHLLFGFNESPLITLVTEAA